MLNQAFPKFMKTSSNDDYILDEKYQNIIIKQNTSTNTGMEERLEKFYMEEILASLEQVGISIDSFNDKVVMDICSGAGFLTYHLLKAGIKPRKIVLCDISHYEQEQSKKLIDTLDIKDIEIQYLNSNVLENKIESGSFDFIIGNSYLHHFYDIPKFLYSIRRILGENGIFISTHEPTHGALAVESGSFGLYLYYLFRGMAYIDDCRYKGDSIKPNNIGDVWTFDNKNVKRILELNGFKDITVKNGRIFRCLLITNLGLSPLVKINFSKNTKMRIAKIGFFIDNILKKILPERFFGDMIFMCKK